MQAPLGVAGAIRTGAVTSMLLNKTTFSHNMARQAAGAVAGSPVNMDVVDCVFDGNQVRGLFVALVLGCVCKRMKTHCSLTTSMHCGEHPDMFCRCDMLMQATCVCSI